jgi:NADH:ubiquinone oxidoreductase subunit E
MAMGTSTLHIRICLGSSCYTRGNSENLLIIKDFVANTGIDCDIDFRGHLCSEKCNRGPVIEIGTKVYEEVSPSSLMKILANTLMPNKP